MPNIENLRDPSEWMLIDEHDGYMYSKELLRSQVVYAQCVKQEWTSPLSRHSQLHSFSSTHWKHYLQNIALRRFFLQNKRMWNHTWYRFLHCGRVGAGRLWRHSSECLPPIASLTHTALWSPSAVHVCSQWSQRHSHCCGAAQRGMEHHQGTCGQTPPWALGGERWQVLK